MCSVPVRCGRLVCLGVQAVLGGIVLFLLISCGRSTFVGKKYEDFTAYYNEFHNAEKAFEKGRAAVRQNKRPIDRRRYVPVFPESRGEGEEEFEKAIQKSAKVLRNHPDSKWVDDALLLIGKSYYYQQNYSGAAEKFQATIRRKTGLEAEARFWKARTLLAAERYDAAADAIETSLQRDEAVSTWTTRLYIARGELMVRQQEWEEAARALQRGLQDQLPARIAVRATFLLGQVHETLDGFQAAQKAYGAVLTYDPPYKLEVAARLRAIELQGLHDDVETALRRLQEMEEDDKNREMRGAMAYVRARIFRGDDRLDAARRVLRDALYGEAQTTAAGPSGEERGWLQYELATLYRNGYQDFSAAAAHFDTASTALNRGPASQEGRTARPLPDVPTDAATQADRFQDLASQARELARLDSLLRLGRLSDEELRAFVADLEAEQETKRRRRQEDVRGRRRRRVVRSRGPEPGQPPEPAAPASQTADSDAGFLFHKDPARVQQARQRFRETWGDRPRTDNWRRRNAIRGSESVATERNTEPEEQTGLAPENENEERALLESEIDVSAIPRDSASRAKLESERARVRYRFANSLFLAAGRPDSAETWYRRILIEDANQAVARKAQYALAEAHRAQGEHDAAREVYKMVVQRNPGSSLAARARERLGDTSTQEAAATTTRADAAYRRAYDMWQVGELDSALVRMLTVARRYPKTKVAPRALLASGMIYWRQIRRDSATAPRSVLHRHITGATAEALSPVRTGPETGSRPHGNSAPKSRLPADTVPAPVGDTALAAAETDSASRAVVPKVDSAVTGPRGGQGRAHVYAPLDRLFSLLIDQYPESRPADRARSLLTLVREQGRAADSTMGKADGSESRPDSTVSAKVGASSSEGVPASADTSGTLAGPRRPVGGNSSPPPDTSTPQLPRSPVVDSSSEERSRAMRPSGGWTLLLRMRSDSDAAQALALDTEKRLGNRWPVYVLPDTTSARPRYRVVVGDFPTRETARRRRSRLKEKLERGSELPIVRIDPGAGFRDSTQHR